MAAKAAVRDVGRVLDLRLQLLRRHRQADSVQAGQARHARRRDARKEPLLAASAARSEDEVQRAARARAAARRPDAQRRHARGRRADRAGQAHRLLPALHAAGHASAVVSQFDKDDVEAVGLVKFDFLGLTTLTILDWARALSSRALDPAQADFDARARCRWTTRRRLRALRRRPTPIAVFQFESRGMQRHAAATRSPTASRTSSRWSRCTGRARWT